LASRLPPRLSRWRVVLPDEAGSGATPHRRAKGDLAPQPLGLSPAAANQTAFLAAAGAGLATLVLAVLVMPRAATSAKA
jgi:hypothetical protein